MAYPSTKAQQLEVMQQQGVEGGMYQLKGTLNAEIESHYLTPEQRTEQCTALQKKGIQGTHEFVHNYDNVTLSLMMVGLPKLFGYSKKKIQCKHCKKTFAKYIPTIV